MAFRQPNVGGEELLSLDRNHMSCLDSLCSAQIHYQQQSNLHRRLPGLASVIEEGDRMHGNNFLRRRPRCHGESGQSLTLQGEYCVHKRKHKNDLKTRRKPGLGCSSNL